MKINISSLMVLFLILGCKYSSKEVITENDSKKLTIAELIAYANGYEHWKNVHEIQFTFNVDRDDNHFERSWTWKPKTDEITMTSPKDTVVYNRKSMDSITMKTDKGFINDTYWLLAPFNLVWDEGTNITTQDSVMAPLSSSMLNKLTIVYGSEGGYTPGDAYDFYYDTNFIIKEWVFREANQEEASMLTTWEDYEAYNGINIAKTHIGKDKSVKLYFTNIKVDTTE